MYYIGMDSKLKWNSEEYELAITQWVVKTLKELGIKETRFSRDAGLGKSETDARTFRKIKQGKRHWSMADLCKLATYFEENPSSILKKIEKLYRTEGIAMPGKTAEKIISMGLNQSKDSPTLISTWQKKGKLFLLMDCDPEWKKSAQGEIGLIIGMSSKEIFSDYPEITTTLENAWKKKGGEAITLWYTLKTSLVKKMLLSDVDKKFISFNAIFVPPDSIVAYAQDVTSDDNVDKHPGKTQIDLSPSRAGKYN